MPSDAVDLYWLPLGAGAHCVRWNGRVYEAVVAAEDRPEPDRGVVGEGPVGSPILGRSRWFRYEVRRWRGGLIPDIAHAVDSPVRLPTSHARARQLLDLMPEFPTRTWGRDEYGTGDMWNSNSLVAWLLVRSDHDIATARMPAGGRAPGWSAGLTIATNGSA